MKGILRVLPFAAAIALVPLISGTAFAASATLYLAPTPTSVVNGSTVTVYIHENSGSEPVNTVQANFSYPTSLLQFISISSSSAFSIDAQDSGSGGSVAVARGTLNPVTGDQVVASVTFKALASSGTANFAFTSGSAVVSSNTNTNIMTSSPNASVTLTAPAPSPTPSPTPSPKPSPSPSPSPSPTPSPTPSTQNNTTPPTISGVSVKNVTTTSATITWTTSKPATSVVEYGLTSTYGLSAVDNSFVTSHSVTLNSALIISGTSYHFLVKSTDQSGNTAASNDSTFMTTGMGLIVTVLDDKTGRPVAGATVSYNGQKATTNAQGQATLTNLPAQKVALQITVNGRQTTETVQVAASTSGTFQNASFKVPVTNQLNTMLIAAVAAIVILAGVIYAIIRARGGNNLNSHFPPYGPQNTVITSGSQPSQYSGGSIAPPENVITPTQQVNPQQYRDNFPR